MILEGGINLNRACAFDGLDAAIPAGAATLFVVNPTHPPSYNIFATFYRTQYFLAPGWLHWQIRAKLEAEMAPYDWLFLYFLVVSALPSQNQPGVLNQRIT